MARLDAPMAAHSMDRRAPATAIRIRNGARHSGDGQSNTQTAHKATPARTAPEAALTPKLSQSKRLARGKNVIDGDAAKSPLPSMEASQGGLQVFGPVVGPIDVLENQFGIGALPKQEIGEALFAARADDQIGRRGEGRGKPRLERRLAQIGRPRPALFHGLRPG